MPAILQKLSEIQDGADGRHFENRYVAISQRTRSSAVERDRATLLVIEYFAKSLKFTQGHSKRHY